ncbi:ribosome-binding factor A [Propionispira arboris]|jgi:ribosome-binding factor A|uniref:Ribosome-binding factor A n=1 Tax=Propionispira arboris TaxID=84035 RepID=A0A1H6WD86_9FIRM|nr:MULTISPECIES: 30S ribosome-binding factor RbfA [Propionispira]SEJ10285.1 ribosome-binding factor A [Propionispira arboris]
MGQLRMEKVQELVKQEVSQIILQELKDPRIGFVTVTQVDVTGDLRSTKIYVSIMGSDEQIKACWDGLQSSIGYIRREIGKRIRLRCTPEVTFQLDKSLDYSTHIQKLLIKIKKDEAE